jgi:FkbM family methyltransferase
VSPLCFVFAVSQESYNPAMPGPPVAKIQELLRECYWQIKSRFLYQTLYRALHLEHKLRSGLTVKVESMGEWWVYNDIFVDGEYDLAIQKAMQGALDRSDSVTTGPVTTGARLFTVLDLGANVGYFAFRVLDLMDGNRLDITMVEGSPKNFTELKSRIDAAEIQPAQKNLVCGLAGERNGTAFIRESAIHVKSTLLHTATAKGTEVRFADLDEVMRSKAEIDLLKCDIEGSELSFIRNYPDLLRKVRTAVFELHHEQCDTKEAVRILNGLGFSETPLKDCGSFSVNLFTRE